MYFSKCETPQQVKEAFKKLAKQYHPDVTGEDTNEKMAEIIAAYQKALKSFHGFNSVGTDGKTHSYRYNDKVEMDIVNLVGELVNIPNIIIEIVGVWVWVSGDTKTHKETFKKLGMRWHSKRVMWYKRPAGYKTRYNKTASFDDLKKMYGSKTVQSNKLKELE